MLIMIYSIETGHDWRGPILFVKVDQPHILTSELQPPYVDISPNDLQDVVDYLISYGRVA